VTDPDPAILDEASLADALAAGAAGWLPAESAVSLLCAHRNWLHRREFRACVDVGFDHCGRLLAQVDWGRLLAADPPASAGETAMLCLAAELAGTDATIPLGELIGSLDAANLDHLHVAISVAKPCTDRPF
jgi:hypothetical protein